jgi:oxygen-independent coproporphyrinogen-3 oxidase
MGEVGLYLHIPFCDARCTYCDFVTFTDQHANIDRYLDALIVEMGLHRGRALSTLFIGGGTPTVLSPAQIDRLMDAVRSNFDVAPLSEATVEANPESADEARLSAFRRGGVNRISFGFQTANPAQLKQIGRLHTRETFFERFDLARSLGFDNINVDLIFGFEGQDAADWSDTLERVIDIAPEHVSTYALKIEPGTPLQRSGAVVDGDAQADRYLEASERLRNAGYEHYEISNFAKPSRRSAHNSRYWLNQETIGLGVSSASYVNGERRKNPGGLIPYFEALSQGRAPRQEVASLAPDEAFRETLMLKLRLSDGVAYRDLEPLNLPMVPVFLSRGLASLEKGLYSLTPQGWLLSNRLYQDFL